jgi:hypothetical protein
MTVLVLALGVGCLPALPDVDRTVAFEPTLSGGFDDWSSDGAALAWAVDAPADRAIVVGVRFDLPAFEVDVEPLPDAVSTAAGYLAAPAPGEAPVEQFPALAAALTSTDGLEAMPADLTAILLEGLAGPTADNTWVAVGGALRLTRRETGRDTLAGDLLLEEVTGFGPGVTTRGDAHLTALDDLDLAWDTTDQP